jgi:hypothetical protein
VSLLAFPVTCLTYYISYAFYHNILTGKPSLATN